MPSVSESLKTRLSSTGTKRILALDGGGIRGAVTLGYLGEIEKILAEKHKDIIPPAQFRLYHYFDLIGGTSTGAIITALLAVNGDSVDEAKEKYRNLGREIFSDRHGYNFFGRRISLNRKYDGAPLKNKLTEIFGEARLGDETNKTGFCAVAKRLDTASTWPVTNNPRAKYFDSNRFFIRDIVRASTAAPSYFEPEIIDVGAGQEGVFVDGGMSMANNPSLQLFLVATLSGFNLKWTTGEDDLLIVSVGTGRRDKKLVGKKWRDPKLWDIAKFAPDQLMSDASELVELMMHYIGKGTGRLRKIDSEVGDLSEDIMTGGKAFSYLRYNLEIVKNKLDAIGIAGLTDEQITNLIEMDLSDNVETLLEIGEAAGRDEVREEHFPKVFDLKEG